MRLRSVAALLFLVACGSNQSVDNQRSNLTTDHSEQLFIVPTIPSAPCHLYMNDVTGERMRIDSDDRGYAQFYYWPISNIPNAPQGHLDCTAEDGSVQSQTINLPALAARQSAIIASMPPKKGKWRPAITNPMSYTQAELFAMGFPPRPDPSSAKYKTWLAQASKPSFMVEGKSIPGEIRRRTVTFGTSANWSGVVLQSSSVHYIDVWGEWNIPANTGISRGAYSVMYVGLDGHTTDNIVQCGSETDNVPDGHGGGTASYGIWWEWNGATDDHQGNFPGVSFGANSDMYFEAWVGDSSGTYNYSGGNAWYFVYNFDTAESTYGHTTAPSGATFHGNSAEFIVERPGPITAPYPLADFDTATMTGEGAFDYTHNNFHDVITDDFLLLDMTDGSGSSNGLAYTVEDDTTKDVWYFWQRPCTTSCP